MFVNVHLRSTMSPQRWADPPQNGKVENSKIGVFRFSGATENNESDKI